MSNDIKVNDLVYVAKPTPCCCDDRFVNYVGTVIEMACGSVTCGHCFARAVASISLLDNGLVSLTESLKKFDPKSQCDDTLLDIVIDRRPELSRALG
jgi:hypothetical protein